MMKIIVDYFNKIQYSINLKQESCERNDEQNISHVLLLPLYIATGCLAENTIRKLLPF